jgi:tRNA(Ile)-lysidine synthase
MMQAVEAFCLHHELIHEGDHIVVACSGGPDSLALLDIMARLKDTYHLQITACYIHHGIRQAADTEVAVVRREAHKRGCDFIWHYVNVPALALWRHESEEATGRAERYRLLRRTAEDCGATAIAVAHHRNDQAETVLLHLLRGSGLAGLGGMRPRSGLIIRPFLAVSRRDIQLYVRSRQLVPCIDETNASRAYTRNRIRLDLLPELQAYNPAVVDDLDRLARIIRADDDFISQEAKWRYETYIQRSQGLLSLPKKELLAEPAAIKRRLIRLLLEEWTGSSLDIPFIWVETLLQLAAKGARKEFRTKRFRAYTTYTDLCLAHAVGRCKK